MREGLCRAIERQVLGNSIYGRENISSHKGISWGMYQKLKDDKFLNSVLQSGSDFWLHHQLSSLDCDLFDRTHNDLYALHNPR